VLGAHFPGSPDGWCLQRSLNDSATSHVGGGALQYPFRRNPLRVDLVIELRLRRVADNGTESENRTQSLLPPSAHLSERSHAMHTRAR
jgi:hypothetical protein